jgi:hypothetical protein
MQRFISTGLLCAAAYFAGYEMNSHMSAAAQTSQARAPEVMKPSLTLLEGKGMYWSGDDLKKLVDPGKGTLWRRRPSTA